MKAQHITLPICTCIVAAALLLIWRQSVLNHREDIVLRFEHEIRVLEAQNANGATLAKVRYFEAIAVRKWNPKEADSLVALGDTLIASERVLHP